MALGVAVLLALNPAFIVTSSCWGQIDSVLALLLVVGANALALARKLGPLEFGKYCLLVRLVSVLAAELGLSGGIWDLATNLDLNLVGYAVAGLFVGTWAVALAVWRIGRIEERWEAKVSET